MRCVATATDFVATATDFVATATDFVATATDRRMLMGFEFC
jgi:hypothetical protein